MNLHYMSWKKFLSAVIIIGFFITGFSSFALAWEPKLPSGVQGPVSWYVNGKAGRYFVPIVQGKILSPASGIVRTDSNCRPDSQGLSHCYNEIELLSGKIITVQNTHKMSKFPCLYPGEHVSVRPNGSSSWAIVQIAP
ncbi:MAG TPA: hypothetical protein ENI54_01745 [bacterium]|nr:hypothetical protein [bacterium]